MDVLWSMLHHELSCKPTTAWAHTSNGKGCPVTFPRGGIKIIIIILLYIIWGFAKAQRLLSLASMGLKTCLIRRSATFFRGNTERYFYFILWNINACHWYTDCTILPYLVPCALLLLVAICVCQGGQKWILYFSDSQQLHQCAGL